MVYVCSSFVKNVVGSEYFINWMYVNVVRLNINLSRHQHHNLVMGGGNVTFLFALL